MKYEMLVSDKDRVLAFLAVHSDKELRVEKINANVVKINGITFRCTVTKKIRFSKMFSK